MRVHTIWKGSHSLSFVLRAVDICLCVFAYLIPGKERTVCAVKLQATGLVLVHTMPDGICHIAAFLSAFLSALMHSVAYRELREHDGKRVAHVIRDQAGGPGRCCSHPSPPSQKTLLLIEF